MRALLPLLAYWVWPQFFSLDDHQFESHALRNGPQRKLRGYWKNVLGLPVSLSAINVCQKKARWDFLNEALQCICTKEQHRFP